MTVVSAAYFWLENIKVCEVSHQNKTSSEKRFSNMTRLRSFVFPDVPPELSDLLFQEDKQMVVIGVLGKSCYPDCNKMAGFKILDLYPSLATSSPKDGRITFYFKETENLLYVHFESTFDTYILKDLEMMQDMTNPMNFHSFNSNARTKFAKVLLFATQICHIIVLVETGKVFDSSYLSMFKALKTIRERYVLKFLPKLLKNSNAGTFMGKDGRLCSPRVIFMFEKCLLEYKENDSLQKLEFDIEDRIYKMLRTEFIITNNSSISLFSIPRNQRYVYVNDDPEIRSDPLIDSIENLMTFIEKASNKDKPNDDWDDIRPIKGFAKPLRLYRGSMKKEKLKKRSIVDLLNVHVTEALRTGFDDSVSKFKGKSHFVIPNIKTWYETFKIIHKIFIENPENPNFEASDVDYKAYLKNFHKIMDHDERFFTECCEYGLELAVGNYKDMLPHHYSSEFHEQRIFQSCEILSKYGRSPQIDGYVVELKQMCNEIWSNGKQQCEILSLRNNPCIMPKHESNDDHSSGVVYISTCNCGRTQGRRDDPYTIRQANYDFYQVLASSCPSCGKLEKINFSVFEPSTNDFRAAEMDLVSTEIKNQFKELLNDQSPILTTTQSQPPNLSLNTIENEDQRNEYALSEDDDSVNEIIIKVGETESKVDKNVLRQPSTTEYLPGMVHLLSPVGLLPQFPSWSLCCIGPSSVYSHNTGLPEHSQSGFLSGANFLLPWDVHVRVTSNTASWAATYEKSRSRKKPAPTQEVDGQVFVLKIFVGCEYECTRGHRFIMNTPDKVLRGGSGIVRDSGSKIVFNDMPLYFPCPCRSGNPKVAQLMRVHIVTPKAPVNVIIDPKVRTGDQKKSYVFTTGKMQQPKLTQSAYWILRLPYIYQGDDGPILPPTEISATSAMMYGCLLAGMYGVAESCAE